MDAQVRADDAAITLAIGGLCVALSSRDPDLRVGVSRESRRFVADGATPDAVVTAAWGDLGTPPEGELEWDSQGTWKLYRQEGGYLFRFQSAPVGPKPFKQARFSADFSRCDVTLHADYYDRAAPASALDYPLDELLFTNLLARGRGVELHALGVRDVDGRGYLFTGYSGAGKSTSARLWEKAGALVLSDDRIIVRRRGGRFWMFGTPWHGESELAEPCGTAIDALCVLGRGRENQFLPLAPADAVSQLFVRAFVPFWYPPAMAYTLDFLQQLAEAVPCAELRFVPDEGVVGYVRGAR